MKTKLLFPNQFKKIGWFVLAPSVLLGILMIVFTWKFEFLKSKVFSIYYSGFSGSGEFLCLRNGNYTNTIIGILILIGLIFVAFSKEKQEDEFIAKTRLESLVWATYINYGILVFCFLFFFDFDFLWVMIFNMFTILIFFIIRFYYILYKTNKSLSHEK